MTVVPHPPYSADLAPCDFFLFPKMKLKLKGLRFETVEETEAESQAVLDQLNKKDFVGAFAAWQKRWIRYINVGGDYFEGDAARKVII